MNTARILRSRQLRAEMTPQEARLWRELRILRSRGFHFRRQAPFRGYYLDFVCFSARLAVEVDGSQHADIDQIAHDVVRDAVLCRSGFQVLRVWNGDINTNLEGVMHAILLALNALD